MLYFYVTVIRPVLKYACLVWHSSATAAQTKALESLQQMAMRIIFQDNDYTLSLIRARLDKLELRCEQLTERFFKQCMLRGSSCLHYLLPYKRYSSITDKMRHAKTFNALQARTVKFCKSFIPPLFYAPTIRPSINLILIQLLLLNQINHYHYV